MASPNYTIIRAKYRGHCPACGQSIEPGQQIKYAKGHPTIHETCEAPEIPSDAIHLEGGSGYGCQGWTPKTVVPSGGKGSTRDRRWKEFRARFEAELKAWDEANPKPANTLWEGAPPVVQNGPEPVNKYIVGQYPKFTDEYQTWRDERTGAQERWKKETDFEGRAKQFEFNLQQHDYARKQVEKEISDWLEGEFPRDDAPEFLYVLTASARYIREDGLSFGVGDESGHVYSAICRPATDEESAPLRQEIAELAAKRMAAGRLQEIRKQIIEEGEWPEPTDGQLSPEGETIPFGPGQNIYGGGAWFVVGSEWVWYVINNGSDGDDWSSNNVRTGGAGAIGRRVPATAELSWQIKSLATAAGFTK